MSSELKHRRGTAAAHANFTGAQGEITIKTDTNEIVVHDGVTPGGWTGGGYLPSGTGAVTRTVQDKLREFVSVKDFGADPTGVADSTAAFRAAVLAGAGGLVMVPNGTYIITDAISLPANTHLCGEGFGSVIKSVTLANGGPGRGHRQIELTNVSGCQISNLTFDCGQLTNQQAGMRVILCSGSSDYKIHSCNFITPGAAVASINCARYEVLYNDVFIQSTTGEAWHDGIIDQWGGSNNFLISGNRIRCNDIGLWPILMTGQATDTSAAPVYNYTITGNHVFNSRQPGIWAMGRNGLTYNFQITQNIVEGAKHGIVITEAYNFVVSGNVLRNTNGCGIRAHNESPIYGDHAVKYGVIAENIIENPNVALYSSIDPGSAISVTDSSQYVEVTRNIVRGSNHKYALHLGVSTSNIIVSGETMLPGSVGWIINNSSSPTSNLLPGPQLYAPTLTPISNVASTNNYATTTMWSRSGNYVTVFGRIEVTTAAGGSTSTAVGISLPVASDFTATQDCAGVASSGYGVIGAIHADPTNNRATLTFLSPSAATHVLSFSFQYRIR